MKYIKLKGSFIPKRGKWVNVEDGFACSECAAKGLPVPIWRHCMFDYCPDCGADMRGAE